MNSLMGCVRGGLSLGLAILFVAPALRAEEVYVKIRAAQVRSQPQHFAKAVQSLKEGDAVEAESSDKGWLRVKTRSGKHGFLHESAISERQVTLKSSSEAGGKGFARSDGIAIAGKGFSPEIEKTFAKSNPSADFAAVNAMEKISPSSGEVVRFMQEGRLGKES